VKILVGCPKFWHQSNLKQNWLLYCGTAPASSSREPGPICPKVMGLPLASSVIKFFTVMNHCHSTKVEIGWLGYPLQKTLLKSQWSDLALSTAFCLHIVSLHSKSTARSKTTTPCTVSIWIQTPHQRSDPPSSSITDLWTFTRN